MVENRTSVITARDQDKKHMGYTCYSALLIDNKGESEQGNVMKITKGGE